MSSLDGLSLLKNKYQGLEFILRNCREAFVRTGFENVGVRVKETEIYC